MISTDFIWDIGRIIIEMYSNIQILACAIFNKSFSVLFPCGILGTFFSVCFSYEFIPVIYYGITKFQLALFYELKFNES